MSYYIDIINNSEKYIELLKSNDKIYIKKCDIMQSNDLLKMSDPLWGFYNVKSFILNGQQLNPNDIFYGYQVLCGDFFCGEGFIIRIALQSKTYRRIQV
jgi:hypothetical protein